MARRILRRFLIQSTAIAAIVFTSEINNALLRGALYGFIVSCCCAFAEALGYPQSDD